MEHFQAITYGNGTFVAVGNLGTVFTSTNGLDWTRRKLPDIIEAIDQDLFGVAYGAGRFVAVGSGRAYYSSEGVEWTAAEFADTDTLYGIAYGAGRFVAVGRGLIYTSTDGAVWTMAGVNQVDGGFYGVAFGGGIFVAVNGNDGAIYTSTDGLAWNGSSLTNGLPLYAVAYGNSRWVAVGVQGTVHTSADAFHWTTLQPTTADLLFGVAFVNGTFVAVGGDTVQDTDSKRGTLLTSTDGTQWTMQTVAASALLTGVAASPDIIVVVGYRGGAFTSSDGILWTPRSADLTRYDLSDIIWARDKFYAVGGMQVLNSPPSTTIDLKRVILTSPDGKTWSKLLEGSRGALGGVCEGSGLLVAVGVAYVTASDFQDMIFTSSDGTSWSRINITGGSGLGIVVFGNGRFVATGGARTLVSTNGTRWEALADGPTYTESLTFVGGKFFARCGSGFQGIRESDDGMTWKNSNLSDPWAIDVMRVNGQFLTVGAAGALFSPDGTAWNPKPLTITPDFGPSQDGGSMDLFYGQLFADGYLIALGHFVPSHWYYQGVYSSTNGTNWVRRFKNSLSSLSKVAFGAGTFVAVGSNGAILQSGVLPPTPALFNRIDLRSTAVLNISAPVGRMLRIECSDSLADPRTWSPLATIPVADSPFTFLDEGAIGRPQRFYRTVTLP
jgi:hypothetical protein